MKSLLEAIIRDTTVTLSPQTPAIEAIAAMYSDKKSCLLAIDQQQLVGILTERDVVRAVSKQIPLETLTLADLMTKTLITLQDSEVNNVFDISQLFSRHQIRHIPVLNSDSQVLGIITPQSIRRLMKPEYLLRYIRVNEVMARGVIQAAPDDTLLTLVHHMVNNQISCVVITNAEHSAPMGIITERDVVQFRSLGLNFDQTFAQQVMSTPLVTILPEDSLWKVHQLMQDLRVRRLVVTGSDGSLVGIVTQSQMMRMLNPGEMYQVMQHMQDVIESQTHELHQLNQELQIANVELQRLATIDELTQVVNRRQFNLCFDQQWKRHIQQVHPLSLLFCDVDHFKLYNDIYGHMAGDACLVKIAQTLQQSTRPATDVVARYGGEEFAIVLPNTDMAGAEQVARHILAQIQKLQIPHAASSTDACITVSLGVATTLPVPTHAPEDLLKLADQMLYQAKRQGRNTYILNALEPGECRASSHG